MTYKRSLLSCLILLLLSLPPVLAAQDAPRQPGPLLKAVQERGQLVCGVNEDVFGFGFLNPNTGDITGLYVDLCGAIATAIFGDPVAAELRLLPLNSSTDMLLAGEVDILLLHDLGMNLTGDSSTELKYGPFVFYDGQSFMVRADTGIETWDDLNGETICTVGGTPAETSLREEMAERGLNYDLLTFPTIQAMQEAFLAGRCNAQTLERSILEIRRQTTDAPGEYIVWEQPFTRSGRGPIYRYGDKQWEAIIDWTLWGLMYAEQAGITSQNIDDYIRRDGESDDAYRARVGLSAALLVDPALGLGGALGLPNDFMATVIRRKGNYGEIYDRHLGPGSDLPIARSLNALWDDGGLLQPPPWR